MRRIIISIGFLIMGVFAFAQEGGNVVQILKGKVIDSATNEPVSYTNIGLENTYYGTASDAKGNFELKIPAELVLKDIFFSAVGFKNKKFPVKTLFDKSFNVIQLESQSYGISDVNVAAQSKVLLRILRSASENIPQNYVKGPLNLSLVYVHKVFVNESLTSTKKASVLVYDENGYSKPSKADAFTKRNYTVNKAGEDNSDYRFNTGTHNLDELMNLDWVRSSSSILNPAILAGFRLSLVGEPNIDGKDCWVISFWQPSPTLSGSGNFYASEFNGKITIRKDDYSVLKLEGLLKSPKNNVQGTSLAIGASNNNYLKEVTLVFEMNYKNGAPAYVVMKQLYKKDGKNIVDQSELTVNEVRTNNLTAINSRNYFTGK